MSATKFEQRLYKVSETCACPWWTMNADRQQKQPEYDSHRPIIVDEELGSPETAALRYEEEALRANGGDYRGASPPGLLPMATFKPHPTQLHGKGDVATRDWHRQAVG